MVRHWMALRATVISFIDGLDRLRAGGRAARYTTALAFTVVGLAVAVPIGLMSQQAPTASVLAAILFAAWLTGLGPAAVAAIVGVAGLAAIDRASMAASSGIQEGLRTLFFFVIALGMAWAAAMIRRLQDDRTRLLDRERAARADAEAATRTRDEFLAIVSHELLTPLSTIVSWLHLLKRDRLEPSKLRHALEAIERNTLVQARLIDDLLDVSRAVGGKLDVTRELLDFGHVVQQVVGWRQPEAETAGVTVKETVAGGGLWVVGDRVRLQQVIGNLISNAVKFTPSGGHVNVEMCREGSSVVVTVRDTGAGISPAELPRVFDLFHQEPSTSRRQRGLGLGLTIAKHIVDVHGGTIAADSAGPGQGATFVVRLPAASDAQSGIVGGDSAEGAGSEL